MIRIVILASLAWGALGLTALTSCSPSEPTRLDGLDTIQMTIGGQAFRLWVADTFETQQRGLMEVTAEEMAPLPDGTERGMLFVFPQDQRNSFWMKDTIIPLDIAYVTREGLIVSIFTMAPLDERPNQYRPSDAYRYAIEVNADRLAALGITSGDILEIPATD